MHFLQKPAPRRAAPVFLRKIRKLSARALSTWRGRGFDFGANVVWMVYHVFAGAGVLGVDFRMEPLWFLLCLVLLDV